jgi:hypothetical protein
MKKIIATIAAFGVIATAWLLFSGVVTSPVSTKHYKKITIQNKILLVSKVQIQPPWSFKNRLSENPSMHERWQKVILLSQSDYLKYLSNAESYQLYGRSSLSDEQIDAQRNYVVNRNRQLSHTLTIDKLYVVLDDRAKTCHMIAPIQGPQGVYYTSFELINGDWHLIPGLSSIPWETEHAKEIIHAIEADDLQYVDGNEFGKLMRKLSATYLEK